MIPLLWMDPSDIERCAHQEYHDEKKGSHKNRWDYSIAIMREFVRRFLLVDHLKQAFSVHLTVPGRLDRASLCVPASVHQGGSTAVPQAPSVRLHPLELLPFLTTGRAPEEVSEPPQVS
ncbi:MULTISPECIES: hypothetical protein [unclassified Rhizobium]|uniref:hypothetical protein n=1 Tax=unclassified Rhizobium TaxID=2613769 RepID=UPI001AED040C|nr:MULTISPECIES: hypothetical protein [unclassified Rhizobium]MDQ4404955.1 hypothetical protein [Rhizobium sp. AN63]